MHAKGTAMAKRLKKLFIEYSSKPCPTQVEGNCSDDVVVLIEDVMDSPSHEDSTLAVNSGPPDNSSSVSTAKNSEASLDPSSNVFCSYSCKRNQPDNLDTL